MSQCDVHIVMIWPFSIEQAGALLVLLRVERDDAPELPAPVPGNDA